MPETFEEYLLNFRKSYARAIAGREARGFEVIQIEGDAYPPEDACDKTASDDTQPTQRNQP